MNYKEVKFLLVGTGNYSNRGCEAIVRGTVEILERYFPHARFVLSSFGADIEKDMNSESDVRIEHKPPRDPYFRRFSYPWWKYRIFLRNYPELQESYLFDVQVKNMQQADCALEIGGDNYSLEYGVPNAFLRLDKILCSTGKPVILWGASVGPFTSHPHVENMMKEHLSSMKLICARESETVTYLNSIGIKDNVKLVADPAFCLSHQKPYLPNELYNFICRAPIGLNLSPLIGFYKKEGDLDQWREEVAECIRSLVNLNMAPVLLIPHVMQNGNNDYDFMFEAAEECLETEDNLRILPPNLSAAEYKWVISKMRIFIGARTHATIAALSTCVPTISIGYSMKARGINKDIYGHLNWLISINEVTPGLLLTKTKELLSSEQSVRLELKKKIPEFKALALSAADYVKEIINKV